MSGARILVVEDDFLVRLTLAEALATCDFEVLEADNVENAMNLLRGDPEIRLLMTDLQLNGGADGRDLARAARALRGELPVIYMTGRPDLVPVGKASQDCVVAKPYLPSEICAVARRMLEGRPEALPLDSAGG